MKGLKSCCLKESNSVYYDSFLEENSLFKQKVKDSIYRFYSVLFAGSFYSNYSEKIKFLGAEFNRIKKEFLSCLEENTLFSYLFEANKKYWDYRMTHCPDTEFDLDFNWDWYICAKFLDFLLETKVIPFDNRH